MQQAMYILCNLAVDAASTFLFTLNVFFLNNIVEFHRCSVCTQGKNIVKSELSRDFTLGDSG